MKDKKESLKIRKTIKGRKPEFIRQDAHKKAEISWKWRKPKGIQSKMRLHKRGYKRSVSPGWGSPADVRGLSREGLLPVIVHNVQSLDKIKIETQGAVIGSAVGSKKRLEIIQKAITMNIRILGMGDPKKAADRIKESIEKRKKEKKAKDMAKAEAQKKKKAEKKEAEGLDEKIKTDDEKKEQEKKEKDKLLTKKEG